ncbi:family 16 glycosylhydrolase [Methylobacterium sp. WL64]|uniref:glycoside hydrolase family 16 protein n=1 Tax=Methylobacterium sp. WL64 TaxID=2603894 RepID=UPI00164FA7DF|nr:glycoside hydrolase family 16 protein [Methylobacterium sp. WL64]
MFASIAYSATRSGDMNKPAIVLPVPAEARTQLAEVATETASPSGFITDSMKLVFNENFDGDSLDLTQWFPGPKPDGGQWGGAHFVTSHETGFTSVYIIKDGMLTLRAHHEPNYKDPENWGRTWYSGQVSTAFPRRPAASAIRKGYIETRAKFPRNKGSWPAFWVLAGDTEPTVATDAGGVEIDALEFYGDAITKFSSGAIYWPGNTGRTAEPGKLVWTDTNMNLTADFHIYGIQITETEAIIYFDRKEVQRLKLPRPKTVGKFFVLLDNAIHTDSGVDVPVNGYADAVFDYVHIWEDTH